MKEQKPIAELWKELAAVHPTFPEAIKIIVVSEFRWGGCLFGEQV